MGRIVINCPPMAVRATNNLLIHQTDALTCNVTIYDDNEISYKGTITYPQCYVRFQSLGYWLVDQVTATGTMENGWDIAITLLPERVIRESLGKLMAEEVKGTGVVWTRENPLARIDLISPAVESHRTGLGVFTVDACTETGEVNFTA